ncbi:MAG: hypothetical protein HYV35_05865 [Lentisphaerae bacterium]|nr:hypothetical protein [Lentisphaerota bacterium]
MICVNRKRKQAKSASWNQNQTASTSPSPSGWTRSYWFRQDFDCNAARYALSVIPTSSRQAMP